MALPRKGVAAGSAPETTFRSAAGCCTSSVAVGRASFDGARVSAPGSEFPESEYFGCPRHGLGGTFSDRTLCGGRTRRSSIDLGVSETCRLGPPVALSFQRRASHFSICRSIPSDRVGLCRTFCRRCGACSGHRILGGQPSRAQEGRSSVCARCSRRSSGELRNCSNGL